MQDSAKYLIHATITANGVVERSDVVGAVFGQTEGLLGDQLDLRELQESSKLGRIDVEISSESGRSFGSITIASGLDRVETAILAAALETIDRVGPCRATIEVTELEDVRTAKRRQVVERARDLLEEFDETVLSSQEIIEAVRQSVRVEEITDYKGYPAGPRVENSDAIIVVEGRADVLTLLRFGIKNAVAVEGTDVPAAIASLTEGRTVTAFLDGDRGGDLILKELEQVGNVDFVAFAPAGKSVEDLSRDEVMDALRNKVPYDDVADVDAPHEVVGLTQGAGEPAPVEVAETTSENETATVGSSAASATGEGTVLTATDTEADEAAETTDSTSGTNTAESSTVETDAPSGEAIEDANSDAQESSDADSAPATADVEEETAAESDTDTMAAQSETATQHEQPPPATEPQTVGDHVAAIVDAETETVRLLDSELGIIDEQPVSDAFETIEDADPTPTTVVLDDELSQRVLDVSAQRGVEQIIARSEGEYVKKPTGIRIRTADEF